MGVSSGAVMTGMAGASGTASSFAPSAWETRRPVATEALLEATSHASSNSTSASRSWKVRCEQAGQLESPKASHTTTAYAKWARESGVVHFKDRSNALVMKLPGIQIELDLCPSDVKCQTRLTTCEQGLPDHPNNTKSAPIQTCRSSSPLYSRNEQCLTDGH